MMIEDPSDSANGRGEAVSITVDVVLALPDRQWRTRLQLPADSRLRDALEASGVDGQLSGQRWSAFAVGVFGRVREADAVLVDGDRVELYRPLTADPKETRRQRARQRGR
jgi:putative ubiquitin-RnfH superfamily antitoxin RatB of RatAB toxin-antitoxin module